jgi:hypothetical protein
VPAAFVAITLYVVRPTAADVAVHVDVVLVQFTQAKDSGALLQRAVSPMLDPR